jgi:hypothetical protein
MVDYLQKQIAIRRGRLAALEKERDKLIIELTAYEDALANAGLVRFAISESRSERLLPVSKAWRAILHRLAEFSDFNASDVSLVAQKLYKEEALRKPLTKDGVRAQLSLYAKKGIIRRRGGGSYLVTEQTKAALADPSLAVRGDRSSKFAAGDAR